MDIMEIIVTLDTDVMKIIFPDKREDIFEKMILPLVKTDCMDYKLAMKLINNIAWCINQRLIENPRLFIEKWACKQITSPIDIALRYAEYKFANCIIKYNVNNIVDMKRDFLKTGWHEYFTSSLVDFIFHFRLDLSWCLVHREIRLKSRTLLEWERRPKNAMKKLTNRGLQRIILLAKLFPGLSASLRSWRPCEPEEVRNYVHCIKICLRSIPDPSITKDEMREFLEFFSDHLLPEETIQAIADKFETLFRPKANYESRSLKHLCRISVRKNLRDKKKVWAFPALVKDLVYPNVLKSYLLCEC